MKTRRGLLSAINPMIWAAVGVLIVVGFLGFVSGVWAAPRVTMEPGDQKANMGLYDDAAGPPFAGVAYSGAVRMPFGICHKPAIEIGVKYNDRTKHTESVYAEDEDVIWRCIQATPDGSLVKAPLVYCMIQNPAHVNRTERAWSCYHDYKVIYNTYIAQYGRHPIIGKDEVGYAFTAVHGE